MITTCIDTYEYDELSEDAKEKALESMYNINVDDDFWYDAVFEDAKNIGHLMGIDIENIYFSGFSSQGDGACFTGHYSYAKKSVKEVKSCAPQDKELHRIVSELADIQKRNFYRIVASVKHSGHYSHEYCTSIDVSAYDHNDNDLITKETEDGIIELLRDYMRWIYRQLEKEYEYMTGREAIEETIRANEYRFTEDGERSVWL